MAVGIAILVILLLSVVLVIGGQLFVSLRDPHDVDDGVPRGDDGTPPRRTP